LIARLLVKPFGSIWKLKEMCQINRGLGVKTRIYRFLYHYYQYEHGSAISFNAKFSEAPVLPHGTKQIVITGDVKIGKNCVIFQQVTIQGDYLANSKFFGSPVIGNNCYIYPGAKIIGNITIGNNVIIGANTVVTQDIPDNSMVCVGKEKIIAL
jgi:serine O-acetyltransferase